MTKGKQNRLLKFLNVSNDWKAIKTLKIFRIMGIQLTHEFDSDCKIIYFEP